MSTDDKTCAACKSRIVRELANELRELRAIRHQAGRVAEAFIRYDLLTDEDDESVEHYGMVDDAIDRIIGEAQMLKDDLLRASKRRGKRGRQ